MSRLLVIVGTSAALSVVGCALIGPGPERRTLIVLDHLTECMGVAPRLCMLTHEPASADLTRMHSGIEGFVYEWGFVHEIVVEDHRVRNPPADGSSIRTVLRRVVAKQRVPQGTEFEMFLTGGPYQLRESDPGVFHAYDAVSLVCRGEVDCAGLSGEVAAGSRVGFRLRHPQAPDLPLEVVAWQVCDLELLGSDICTS